MHLACRTFVLVDYVATQVNVGVWRRRESLPQVLIVLLNVPMAGCQALVVGGGGLMQSGLIAVMLRMRGITHGMSERFCFVQPSVSQMLFCLALVMVFPGFVVRRFGRKMLESLFFCDFHKRDPDPFLEILFEGAAVPARSVSSHFRTSTG